MPTGQAGPQEHELKPMRTKQNLGQSLPAPAVLLKSAEAGCLPMELTAHLLQESEQLQELQRKVEWLEAQRLPRANEMNQERSHNRHEHPGPPAPTFHTHTVGLLLPFQSPHLGQTSS